MNKLYLYNSIFDLRALTGVHEIASPVVNSNTADRRIFDARCITRLFEGFNEFANAPAARVVISNCLLTIWR